MRNVLAIGLALVLVTLQPAAAQQSEPVPGLIGTWILVDAERATAAEPIQLRGARGILILDGAGNVFEYFNAPGPQTGPSQQSDPQRTLAEVGGFWGRYAVDVESGRIDFQSEAGVSPSVTGLSFSRSFRLDADRLVVTSTAEPQAQGHMQWTWERFPVVENLSPAYREVVGFWRHIEERRIDLSTGEIQNSSRRAPSVIVYTPSGFVGVHFPTLARMPFADANDPTDDEARDAVRGYLGYFGALSVFPGEVSHNVLSGVSPGTGAILRRYAAIDGDELIVTLQGSARAADDDRPRFATEVVLHRLSGADDMLGPADRD
jgi:hypothetical protein